jgi:hypothetical protein
MKSKIAPCVTECKPMIMSEKMGWKWKPPERDPDTLKQTAKIIQLPL